MFSIFMESLFSNSLLSLLYALIFSCLLIAITMKFINIHKTNKQKLPLPPGPSPWPIVGSLPELRKNKPGYKWINGLMKQFSTDIACIRLGNDHIIAVSSAELSRKFLQEQDATFASRPVNLAAEYATYGYLTGGLSPMGEQWTKMRKLYARELVCPERTRWLLKNRHEEADNLVNFIYNMCCNNGGAVVNVRSVARHYCVNVARKMTFTQRYLDQKNGVLGGPGEAEEEYVDALFTLLEYLNSFCISDYLPWLRVLDLDGHEKIVKNARRVLDKYNDPIIDDRIQQWKDGKRKEPEDLLDIMILLKDRISGDPLLSRNEIRAQCCELFFPSDSPSNAVEWIIAEMINQPHIFEKARKEIDEVVGKDRLVQESDIPHLNYLKACAKESLRLHPATPFNLPHVSLSDTNVGGYFIPKGSHILLSRTGLGRHPDVWEEPLKFKPERHFYDLQSKVEIKEPDLKFITFSRGKRGCPAISLGTEMIIMALGRLLQGFTWSAPPNVKKIELAECSDNLTLAKPLYALAKPRLPKTTYPITTVVIT